jgi:hypothetical protein
MRSKPLQTDDASRISGVGTPHERKRNLKRRVPAVSGGGLKRAAIRGTADSPLASSHVHASSKMSDICVLIMH